MDIFYFGYSLDENSGGIENYTITILEYLRRCGHNVVVYTVNGVNDKFKNIPFKEKKHIDKCFFATRITNSLQKTLPKVDLFLCGHLFLAKHMEKIVKKYNKKYHLFVYGIDCWGGRFESRYSKLSNLDKIISISSFTTEQIKEQGFKGDIVYVPPVLNLDKFPEVESQKYGNKISFVTVGRLSSEERYKGHDRVLHAIHILISKYKVKNIIYRIIGKGNDKKRLEQLTKDLNVDQYVKFYGFVSDGELREIYSRSDVFIMPSNVSIDPVKPEGEGFGIVFTEAAMYKLPLIGPHNGGSTDIIDDRQNGLECDPLSPEDIADKMNYLIENEDLRIQYGEQAKKKILDNFTLDQLGWYLGGLSKELICVVGVDQTGKLKTS